MTLVDAQWDAKKTLQHLKSVAKNMWIMSSHLNPLSFAENMGN